MKRSFLLALLLAAGAAALPGWGASPKVSLRLERVTAMEAAAALERASGIPVELRPWARSDIPGANEPPLIDLGERASFDWTATTFARALRELGDRYRLRGQPRHGSGFLLVQEGLQGPAPVYRGPAGHVRGAMRVEARRVVVGGDYSGRPPGERVVVHLHGTAQNGDAAAVVRLENVAARDERGGILVPDRPVPIEVDPGYPGEWSASVSLSGLQPGAGRLEWLDGEVIFTPLVARKQCEAPLPLPQSGARRDMDDVVIEFLELTPGRPLLVTNESERRAAGPSLRVRLQFPRGRGTGESQRGPERAVARAGGRLGADVRPVRRGHADGDAWRGAGLHDDLRVSRDRGAAGGRAVRVRGAAACGRLGGFRIRNVPLPTEARPADQLFSGALMAEPFGAGSPYFDAGGATLVSPVEVEGRPAPRGRLSIGLAPADGSDRTAWYEVEVGEDGAARLRGLREGRYRVLRVYTPVDHTLPRRGWWEGGEVMAVVRAGREELLPPLRMPTRQPAPARPAPGVVLPVRQHAMEAALGPVSVRYTRTLKLVERPETDHMGWLGVELSGSHGETGADRLFGVRNVVARDDRGNLLTWRSGMPIKAAPGAGGHGATWQKTMMLNRAHPEARTLTWLEGDLMAYRRLEPVRLEFALPVAKGGVRRQLGELLFEVDSAVEMEEAEGGAGAEAPGRQYLVKGRARGPEGTRFRSAKGGQAFPVVLGRSGRVYHPAHSYDSVGGGRWEFRSRFELPEPVEAMRLELTAWTDVGAVGSFRLTGIPLPPPRFFVLPRQPAPERQRSRLEGGIRTLLQEGGGRLVLPVRLGARPAPDGVLMVGLAPKTPEGWGAVRWTEVEVQAGTARIEDLKPGVYRLVRSYQPFKAPEVSRAGKWVGAEARVTLAPGKETTAPPLRWIPDR